MDKNKPSFTSKGVIDYEARRYRGWDQRLVHSREIRILEKALSHAAEGCGPALDLPCGCGRFTGLLLEQGWQPVNADYSIEMVRRALDRSRSLHQIPGIVADAKANLPFRENSFDLILAMRFFHHVHDSDELLSILTEFARVSKDWIIASYYKANALHRLQRWFRGKAVKGQTRIKTRSQEEMKTLASLAGLRIVRVYPMIRGLHSQHILLLSRARS